MKFDDILGNIKVKKYLLNSVNQNNILHSYLFSGTDGIGKFLISKAFAKKILCLKNEEETCKCKSCLCFEGKNHPDFITVNEDGNTIKIEEIRNITEKVIEKPIVSLKKVYIINDCEKMTKEAQNCLLKTLEEPPEFVTLILISSNENLLLNTIKSRCMNIKFEKIPNDILKEYCIKNIEYENITENMLKCFDGSIRKAILLKSNEEIYRRIDELIIKFNKKDLIDNMLDSKILYDKDNIYNILDYMIVFFYTNFNENKKYIYCIEYVNECLNKIKANSNFDMSIDIMLLNILEELNENSYRS